MQFDTDSASADAWQIVSTVFYGSGTTCKYLHLERSGVRVILHVYGHVQHIICVYRDGGCDIKSSHRVNLCETM